MVPGTDCAVGCCDRPHRCASRPGYTPHHRQPAARRGRRAIARAPLIPIAGSCKAASGESESGRNGSTRIPTASGAACSGRWSRPSRSITSCALEAMRNYSAIRPISARYAIRIIWTNQTGNGAATSARSGSAAVPTAGPSRSIRWHQGGAWNVREVWHDQPAAQSVYIANTTFRQGRGLSRLAAMATLSRRRSRSSLNRDKFHRPRRIPARAKP
jgi:hypothetical protein